MGAPATLVHSPHRAFPAPSNAAMVCNALATTTCGFGAWLDDLPVPARIDSNACLPASELGSIGATGRADGWAALGGAASERPAETCGGCWGLETWGGEPEAVGGCCSGPTEGSRCAGSFLRLRWPACFSALADRSAPGCRGTIILLADPGAAGPRARTTRSLPSWLLATGIRTRSPPNLATRSP